MIINLKKIAPIAVSALMIGMTAAGAVAADLASYPAPFVEDGFADVALVFGENADTTDAIAAFDIGIDLQGKASAGTTTTTATTGETVNLATDNTKLYFGSIIKDARTSLTKNEMSTLLADGELSDDGGTTYDYSQDIELGSTSIAYGKSEAAIDDPTLYLNVGTTATGGSFLYRYKLTFDKSVNVSSSDVQGNSFNIMGQEYTIGSRSTNSTLYLYGAGIKKTLNEGESATMTVDGKEYTVEIGGVSDSNTAFVTVNGLQRKCDEGNTYRFVDIDIYVKNVFHLGKDAQTSYVELQLGAKKLKFSNGNKVKEGIGDGTSIKGTNANLTASGVGQISALHVDIAMKKTKTDHIALGESFTDPVFGGLKVSFSDITTPLDDAARDKVYLDTDYSRNARITFTDFLSGKENRIVYAHDGNDDSDTVTPLLADSSNYTYHVVEGEYAKENEYIIVNSGDYGRILEISDIDVTIGDSEVDTVTFIDLLTDETMEVTLNGDDGQDTYTMNGQTYHINATDGSHVAITWGALASYGAESSGTACGTYTTVFPRIKLAKGGWLAFLDQVTLKNSTNYIFPGAYAFAEEDAYKASADNFNSSGGGSDTQGSLKVGEVNYTTFVIGNDTAYLKGIDVNNDGTVNCWFNSTVASAASKGGPAILILEEYRTGQTNGDAICVPLILTAGSGHEVGINSPVSTDAKFSFTDTEWTSDEYKKSALTKYGTYTIYDKATGSNYMVTMYYPDEEVQANIYFAEDTATISPGTTTAGGGSLGIGAAVKDSEVGTVQDKNLVVIGGSCINTVAAKLLGSTTPVCGSGWTDLTGVGIDQALIKMFDSPYTDDKVALLVAGWEGKDTYRAAKVLVTGTPVLSGEEVKLNTVSTDAVVVE